MRLLNAHESGVVAAAASTLAHLVSGDVHTKRVLMAEGGMLTLAEVLFRANSAEAGIVEAAQILCALSDACSPSTIQRCAIRLPEPITSTPVCPEIL